jgi:hypothetical protein
MKVITPTPITDALFVSSTAPEADYAAYAAGTTYALGARVIRTSTHRIYESLQAGNTGHTPESSPTWWLDIGPTNRWAMFDSVVGTSTTLASPLTVVIAPGAVNALALLELVGSAVTVSMTSVTGGGAVYSRTVDLDASEVGDYYEYFFSPFRQRSSVVLTDMPPYADGIVTVSLTGSTVSLGVCAVGLFDELGEAEYGATAGITDYSLKTTDDFGNTTLTRRSYAKRTTVKMWLDKGAVNRVHRTLADLRATPCVWVGVDDDELDPLTVYGFFKDFQIEVAYPTTALCSLDIEGLT